jgi:hypothetical protein
MKFRLRIAGLVTGDGSLADGFGVPCRNRDTLEGQCHFSNVRRCAGLGVYFSSAIHISKGSNVSCGK